MSKHKLPRLIFHFELIKLLITILYKYYIHKTLIGAIGISILRGNLIRQETNCIRLSFARYYDEFIETIF